MHEQWIKPDFEGILPELKPIPNWVLAKAVVRDGKTTKPPFQPDGQHASATNKDTWSTFTNVKNAYERGGFIGVGFVLDAQAHFNGLYLHGFDWDHCKVDGVTDDDVEAIVQTLGISRLEVSISGTGLRGFFLHHQPLNSCRSKINNRSVELYSDKRYMTTTGVGSGSLL
jgi:putative DNA primase/helicase